jgi:hypothetical protein
MEDYDDGPSPFRMMGILGMVAPMMATILMAGLVWMGLLYIVARWRNNRAAVPDPQLGLKFALHLFRFHGFQLLLAGAFMLVYTILHKGGGRGDIVRPALGLLVVGGLVFGSHTLLLTKTNQDSFTLMGRLFGGLNLIISGLVGFIALVIAFQMLFQKGSHGDEARLVWSLVLTYVTAWGVQGMMLGKSMLDGPAPDESAGRVGPTAPPSAPVPEPMRQPLA